jgi:hypothetical protein
VVSSIFVSVLNPDEALDWPRRLENEARRKGSEEQQKSSPTPRMAVASGAQKIQWRV